MAQRTSRLRWHSRRLQRIVRTWASHAVRQRQLRNKCLQMKDTSKARLQVQRMEDGWGGELDMVLMVVLMLCSGL